MVESEFGINRMRIWIPLVTTVQAAGGGLMVVVGDVFLAHFRPLSDNWSSFKCHSLPEHCF